MIKFGNYKRKLEFKYTINLNPKRNYVGYGSIMAVMDSSGEIYLIDPPEPSMDKIQGFTFRGSSVLSDKIQPSDKYNLLIFKSKKEVIDFIKSHKSLRLAEFHFEEYEYNLIDNRQFRLLVES